MTLRGTGCGGGEAGALAPAPPAQPPDPRTEWGGGGRRCGGRPAGTSRSRSRSGGDPAPPAPAASLPHAPPERARPRSRDPQAETSPRALEGSGLVAGSGGGETPASRAPCGPAPRAGGGECGTIQASLAPPQRPPPNLSPPTSPAGAPAPTPLPHPGTGRSGPSSARGHSALPGDAGDPRTCGCPRCPVRRPKAGTRRGRWTQGPVG
ncbi:translation initiation factor IF-2-like [Lutra lutra]|uniref:translation initiation factor IF-2-like n=1 Tax=Lutra lutra TaxID=9657 RepID=UPI001FD56653|nr:translation initiation factor IF-2-like [Lutra lutra]